MYMFSDFAGFILTPTAPVNGTEFARQMQDIEQYLWIDPVMDEVYRPHHVTYHFSSVNAKFLIRSVLATTANGSTLRLQYTCHNGFQQSGPISLPRLTPNTRLVAVELHAHELFTGEGLQAARGDAQRIGRYGGNEYRVRPSFDPPTYNEMCRFRDQGQFHCFLEKKLV